MSDLDRRILVPLDGSPLAEEALKSIHPFVAHRPAQVVLLHVFEGPAGSQPLKAYLEKAAAGLKAKKVETSIKVRVGRPAVEIASCAREQRVDLIAMSTHGRNGLNRVFMGSVTEDVLRHADAPLLVCRPGMRTREWRPIIVPLDGSSQAEKILPLAASLTRELRATLHVVRVAFPVISPEGVGEFGVPVPSEDPAPYLAGVCEKVRAGGVIAEPVSRTGRAAAEVVRFALEVGAGLICMTTHGRTGLPRFLLGSIAEEILRTSPCPVLVRRNDGR